MILRIFLVLLALNMAAFVVRAEASEQPDLAAEAQVDDLYELQERMSGDFERGDAEALTTLGSRLLSWRFSKASTNEPRYASDAAIADHGIALINEGACLNLKWNF
ncbi:hypothetical protein [Marinobacter caseinilyticus]|uniref:hypothetical protein n=1 Tax=Marinobacter caseinilyticus TaxID=2692195 RepID=UPI00140DE709|nr:hypothetical protein [Marinobacter caseinilyticus]